MNNAAEAADGSGKLRRRRAENVWKEAASMQPSWSSSMQPGLVNRAQSGGRAEDVVGALAESSGVRRQLCCDPNRQSSLVERKPYGSALQQCSG